MIILKALLLFYIGSCVICLISWLSIIHDGLNDIEANFNEEEINTAVEENKNTKSNSGYLFILWVFCPIFNLIATSILIHNYREMRYKVLEEFDKLNKR